MARSALCKAFDCHVARCLLILSPPFYSCQLSKLPPARGAPLGARGLCIANRCSDDPRAHPGLHHTSRAAQSAAAQCLARLGVTVNESMRSWPPNHSGTAVALGMRNPNLKKASRTCSCPQRLRHRVATPVLFAWGGGRGRGGN